MARHMTVAALEEAGFVVYDGQEIRDFGVVQSPVAAFGSIGEALAFIARKMAPVEMPSARGDGEQQTVESRRGFGGA